MAALLFTNREFQECFKSKNYQHTAFGWNFVLAAKCAITLRDTNYLVIIKKQLHFKTNVYENNYKVIKQDCISKDSLD